MSKLEQLHKALREAAPALTGAIFDKLAPLIGTTEGVTREIKDLNDPIWNLITLRGPQVTIINTPLMQRLRRVRQLGLAHLVYPGAQHSRLEHSIGSMRAATLMLQSLNGDLLQYEHIRELNELVSLAALIHDCGHPCFGHLTERVLDSLFGPEFEACYRVLAEHFSDPLTLVEDPSKQRPRNRKAKIPAAAEVISALFAISPAMVDLLDNLHLRFNGKEAAEALCGLIIGRPTNILRHNQDYYYYIRSIVSGDIDCDKLDYVARDAY